MNDRLSNDDADHRAESTHTDEQTAFYHTRWDEDSCVAETVARAVAAVSDTPPTELEPIFDVIDPDALAAIVTSLDGADGGYITFTYAGYDVVVRSNGQLTLGPHGT